MRKRRGLSLVEVAATVGITVMLVGLAISQRPTTPVSQAKSLSQVLRQTLAQVRQQAVSSGRLTALAIPQSRALAQGAYSLQGEVRPHVLQRYDWSKDFPQAALSCWSYPGMTWSSTAPSEPLQGEINLSQWSPPAPGDGLIIFRPDGKVQSNRPWANDHLYIPVSNGFSLSSNQIEQVDAPYLVSISRWGEIQVGQLPPVLQRAGISFDPRWVSNLPSPTPPGNQPPVIVGDVRFTPGPQPSLQMVAPPGSHAVIPPDGLLTVEIRATDPDGDSLSCLWSVAGGSGSFSAPVRHRMRWLESEQVWLGRWSWQPPPGAQPGQVFQLDCQVEDQKGGATAAITLGGATIVPKVAISKPGRLTFGSNQEIWVCNWDGTDAHCIVRGGQLGYPYEASSQRWSPDGRKIAFKANDFLWLVNDDGSDLHKVAAFTDGYGPNDLCWSYKGDQIYMLQNSGSVIRVVKIPATARGVAPATDLVCSTPIVSGEVFGSLSLHPNGKLFSVFSWTGAGAKQGFIWEGSNSGEFHLNRFVELEFSHNGRATYCLNGGLHITSSPVVADVVAQTITFPPVTPPILTHEQINTARLSPDGQWVHFQDYYDGRLRLFLARANGSEVRQLEVPCPTADNSDWSYR